MEKREFIWLLINLSFINLTAHIRNVHSLKVTNIWACMGFGIPVLAYSPIIVYCTIFHMMPAWYILSLYVRFWLRKCFDPWIVLPNDYCIVFCSTSIRAVPSAFIHTQRNSELNEFCKMSKWAEKYMHIAYRFISIFKHFVRYSKCSTM